MAVDNTTILLIDDDPDDLLIFGLALKEIGDAVKLEYKDSCEEAIQALSEKAINPNYIFLDLNLPKMQGSECLIHLKAMEHLSNTRIIIYTTSKRLLDKFDLMAKGADHYISKTNTFADLVTKIKEVLN